MPTVALVRLRYASQEYWFDPNDSGAQEGDHVIVETVYGKDVGLCIDGDYVVKSEDIQRPLKPVVRIATEEDLALCDELGEKEKEGMRVFRELVEKHGLDMRPTAVEFMFDQEHATFYFTADERVDFRSLVRDLASQFHVRIDMRQIGVRDEARMFGGLGHCGQELCCARMGGEFQPVSIRMAKEQDLPLNPTKISGLCGRLMCCLRYEFEAYKDFKGRAPKKNALIETPRGLAKVVEFDTPRETVRVRYEDGKSLVLPVSALDTGDKVAKEGERIRPCHISEEKFDQIIEELNHDSTLAMMGDRLFSSNPELADQEAEAGSVERNPHRPRRRSQSRRSDELQGGSEHSSRRRRRSDSKPKGDEPAPRDHRRARRSVSATGGKAEKHETERTEGASKPTRSDDSQKPRSRRRRSRGGHGRGQGEGASRQDGAKQNSSRPEGKPRPGQHSSTVSGDAARADKPAEQKNNRPRKRRRRRSGGNKGTSGAPNKNTSGESGAGE